MTATENEFVEQLRRGDAAAFTRLVEQYQQMIYNTVLGILQWEADADDVTQDVFVQAYQSIQTFKGESKLSTWLYRIAVTKALDHEKKAKRQKRFAVIRKLLGHEQEEIFHPPDFNHPGVLMDNREKAAVLFKAMKQLPEQQRIAFTLNKVEGLSNPEIAEILHISFTAVESLQARAKKKLRAILQSYYEQQLSQ